MLSGEHDRLEPAVHAELSEDVLDVVAHSRARDAERLRDLRVARSQASRRRTSNSRRVSGGCGAGCESMIWAPSDALNSETVAIVC